MEGKNCLYIRVGRKRAERGASGSLRLDKYHDQKWETKKGRVYK